MPSCWTRDVTDEDELRTALRPSESELTVTGQGSLKARVTRIDLQELWMQSSEEMLPRILQGQISSERAGISFALGPGPAFFNEGSEIEAGNIALHAPGRPIWHRLTGALHWGSMSLSLEDWDKQAAVAAGYDMRRAFRNLVSVPGAPALERLRGLHLATVRLVQSTPGVIENPEVVRGVEQSLIDAMLASIPTPDRWESTIAQRHHATIMTRFRAALEQYADRPVYVPELCAAIRVADRTLRVCCNEHLGMGPKRYLLLRRMSLARRALRNVQSNPGSVTEIAMQFGFWELGRFAVEYRSIFGESPSATLRRALAGGGLQLQPFGPN